MKLHLVMPMGGKGSRFSKVGFDVPKPIIPLRNKPFFYWSVQSVVKFVEVVDITFVVLKEHVDDFGIDTEIRKYYPLSNIVVIPEVLNGAVLTCLEGIKKIKDKDAILFNDCDHMFKSTEFNNYMKDNKRDDIDGAILTFESNEPKYSYVAYDSKGNVIETVEKKVISSDAICGAYLFKNKQLFENNAKEYLDNCNYSEFFVSGVYNILAKNNGVIKSFPCDYHIPYGVPEEYIDALESDKFGELE